MDNVSRDLTALPVLTPLDRSGLLEVARDSIGYGLRLGKPLPVDPGAYAQTLRAKGATFVTLRIKGSLRGCVGSLEAFRPIVTDVAHHAYGAAFRDPRFSGLTAGELDVVTCHISLLSRPQPVSCDSEEHLLTQLRPGVDGLVLERGSNRGTFLPSVWSLIPQADQFLAQLKAKAGLRPDEWPSDIKVSRYEVEEIEKEAT